MNIYIPKMKYIKSSLFVRITILVSLLLFFIVSVNTVLSIRRETSILMKGLIEKNKLFITQLSTSVKSSFRTLDWYTIENLVKKSVESEEVVYCRVVKPDGEIFLADDRTLYGKKADGSLLQGLRKLSVVDYTLPETGERIKIIVNPIKVGNDRWSVWLAVSLKPINLAKKKILYLNLLEGILIILIGSLITLWLSRSITKPISRLVEGTKQVSSGNLEYQTDVVGHDEIGKLARDFNQMTRDLKKSRDEIEAYSKGLEERVKERTKELRHEINERKQAEAASKESEDKYRSLFGNIADAIFISDQETGKFLDCNQAAIKRYGYTLDELKTMTPIQILSGHNRKQAIRDIINQDKVGPYVHTHITRSGEEFPVEVHSKKINYKDRKAWISIVRDITDRKNAEEKRKRLEAQLQRAQKMEAIGTLAGGVAHDLNNILSGLVSYPDLILLDLPENSPLLKPLLTIKQSGEKAATIVQDLLTLARRGVAVKKVINFNNIVEEYLNSPEHEKN